VHIRVTSRTWNPPRRRVEGGRLTSSGTRRHRGRLSPSSHARCIVTRVPQVSGNALGLQVGYITETGVRAGRRRSGWNLLLIPSYIVPWFLLVFGSLVALGRLYAFLHDRTDVGVVPDTGGGILMAVGALFMWLGPSMILANQLVSFVRPARRALDLEAAAAPGTDRASANRGLLKMTLLVTPVALTVALVGLLIPW
jgi:hypothetical protein